LIEYYECDSAVLDDFDRIKRYVLEAARECGATVLDHSFHRFSPQGVSGVVVIAESHIAIHTWPEYRYASVDIFTCGTRVRPWDAYERLKVLLRSQNAVVSEVIRGKDYDKVRSLKAQGAL